MGEWLRRASATFAGRYAAGLLLGGTVLLGTIRSLWEAFLTEPAALQAIQIVSILIIFSASAFFLWLFLIGPTDVGNFTPRWRQWRYQLPFRRVAWDLNNYLSCSGERHGETLIVGFQAHLKITRGEGIRPKRCYIECKRTNTRQDVKINVLRSSSRDHHKLAEEIEFLPSGDEPFYCLAWFEKDGDHSKISGATKAAFLRRYDGMNFVFEYDNSRQKIFFSRREMEEIINANWQYMNKPPASIAKLRSV